MVSALESGSEYKMQDDLIKYKTNICLTFYTFE